MNKSTKRSLNKQASGPLGSGQPPVMSSLAANQPKPPEILTLFHTGLLLLYIECERAEKAGRPVSIPRFTRIVDAMQAKVSESQNVGSKTGWSTRAIINGTQVDWLVRKIIPAMPLGLWLRLLKLTDDTDTWKRRSLVVLMQAQCWGKAFEMAEQMPVDYQFAVIEAMTNALPRTEKIASQNSLFISALKTAGKIADTGDQTYALVILARFLVQRGDAGVARDISLQALEAARKTELVERRDVELLGDIATVLAEIGDIGQARQILSQAMGKAGQINDGADKSYLQVSILRITATILAQAGEIEQARTTLTQALQRVEDGKDKDLRNQVIKDIVEALIQAGDFDQALANAETIEGAVDQVLNLQFITAAMLQAGKTKPAAVVLSRLLEIVEQIESVELQVSFFGDIACMLMRMGKLEQAQAVLATAFKVVKQFPYRLEYEKGRDLKALINAIAAMGEFAGRNEWLVRLLQEMETIKSANMRINELCRISIILIGAGEIERVREIAASALKMAGNITDVDNQIDAFARIADVLAQAGETRQAKRAFACAIKAVSPLK
jgi:tetratricopeptide (TPR) repeat protein